MKMPKRNLLKSTKAKNEEINAGTHGHTLKERPKRHHHDSVPWKLNTSNIRLLGSHKYTT